MERFTSWSHNTDEPVTIAALLKQKTGKTWYWKFATLSGSANGIGNMILSRVPIDASEPRLLSGGRSALDVAITYNGRTINLTSTHLHPDSSSYRLTESASYRRGSWGSPNSGSSSATSTRRPPPPRTPR